MAPRIVAFVIALGVIGIAAPSEAPAAECGGVLFRACTRQLVGCSRGIGAATKTCLTECRASAERSSCLARCAGASSSDADECASGFGECLAPCAEGSTTTTTLPGSCGPDPTTGACGGKCPPDLVCAPAIGPSGIAATCVCRPAGALGRCFVTVSSRCSDEPCGPGLPCANPNEICSAKCLGTSTTTTTLPGGECNSDTDCDDGVPCTADTCVDGRCEHDCLCVDPAGVSACCPGPSTLCARPCGSDAAGGTCGGLCPDGATCEPLAAGAAACACVSGVGGPCGGFIFPSPPVCAPGLTCKQPLPDVMGTCVADGCVPLFTSGCAQTSDCCSPCTTLGRAPCAVCSQGECVGTP